MTRMRPRADVLMIDGFGVECSRVSRMSKPAGVGLYLG